MKDCLDVSDPDGIFKDDTFVKYRLENKTRLAEAKEKRDKMAFVILNSLLTSDSEYDFAAAVNNSFKITDMFTKASDKWVYK